MIRFSLFGFPIAIHWMFWVTAVFLSGRPFASTPGDFRYLLAFVLAALISIILHELGHAFLQRRYGGRVQIMLVAFGGLAISDRGFTRQQHIKISLAGPIPQIIIGVLALKLLKMSSGDAQFIVDFLRSFAWVSIIWGIFNLFPIYPMDGGKVLFHFLGPRLEKVTYIVGIVGAAALALWALSRGSTFSTLFLGMMAYENYQRYRGDRTAGMLYPN